MEKVPSNLPDSLGRAPSFLALGAVAFPRGLWVWLVLGFGAVGVVTLSLNLPDQIRRGEMGQAAIQMLDAMRRPFLAVKEAEATLIRTGDAGSAGRELAEAVNEATALLVRYRLLAQYNPDLSQRVAELSDAYEVWLASERRLFDQYPAMLRHGGNPRRAPALSAEIAAAASGFLHAMNRLGEGEEPIHRDIDRGRSAGHILLGLLASAALYSIGLIVLFQRSRSRELQRACDDLEKRALERTANIEEVNRTLEREIHEREQAQRRLAERENRLRAIVDAEPECVKLLAADGTVLEMNPAGLSMVEADSPEQVVGRSVYTIIAPEHRQSFQEHVERVFGGQRETFEFEIVGQKGARRWLRTHAVLLKTGAGEDAAYLGITQNVTEQRRAEETLRQSEESFRALADNANDSIVVAVEPERHVYANRPAAEMIGYTVEELLAKTPRDIVHPDEYPKLAERLRKRLAGENVPTRYETVILHKDGRLVPVEVTAARTAWHGRPASIVITRDMTEQKQSEEERAALYQQNRALLRQLLHLQEEERKRLAQEIHDDLGQSLTAIMTNARLIAKNCTSCKPEYGEAAREIVSIADGVYESVQRMSRRLRPSALDDLGLMDALRTMVETSPLKKAGVDFTISFGGELSGLEDPVTIALYRVVQECLTNISKHSGAGHVTITLQRTRGGAGANDGKGETVELVVEDNGRGIDQARASQGLGLIGIRERVETLGGEFHIFSGPGKGTSVRVALPVSRSMERAGV